jgi:transcriptional regulator with XRE-family HTH domain
MSLFKNLPPDPRIEVVKKAPRKALVQFGKNLNKTRLHAKLSQEQLAVKADFTRRYIQNLESGQKSPTLFALKRLTTALKCSYQDLLNGV